MIGLVFRNAVAVSFNFLSVPPSILSEIICIDSDIKEMMNGALTPRDGRLVARSVT